ncbi:LysR family transcriptional regulator [Jhaorihella thermophila]|uniref:DNA-binding transcriptional regulator, LysR family n=1 Tax=Jhaorihella thermophila TaxID=488547 RepID=A0A1H5VKK4_9RHOB|nr:LysR family transcriptional regulator [Jhaorihella thermophila]SEF87750.1 DNA-binding transcriptional regulator, LysR family [Jhaorihella thermophila]
MKLVQLETFLWVATLGSFRKVAERLNTTQPAISSRIAALEETLGGKLFERGPRMVTLTALGQSMVPYAEKIIYMTDRMRAQAGSAGETEGVLRLGVSETIVHTWLPAFLRQVHDRYPGLDVDLTVDVSPQLQADLLAQRLDLALLLGPVPAPEVAALPLASYPLVWLASPALAIETPATVEELARHRILTFSRNTRVYAELRDRLRRVDGAPARISASASLSAIRRLAVDGMGIAVLPRVTVEEELRLGLLRELDCAWRPSDFAYSAAYPATPFRPLLEHLAGLAVRMAEAGRE